MNDKAKFERCRGRAGDYTVVLNFIRLTDGGVSSLYSLLEYSKINELVEL